MRAMSPRLVLPLLLPLLLGSCIYTSITQPLDRDLDASKLGTKEGRSTLKSVAWLVAWGDAGTHAAAQQGGLEVIYHADQHILSILNGLWYEQTTILYGE